MAGAHPAFRRYKGGRTGSLWVDPDNSGTFARVTPEGVTGAVGPPLWIGDRLYFITDDPHVAAGRAPGPTACLCSCDLAGRGVRRVTEPLPFCARNATTDGRTVVFHAGGQLYAYAVATGALRRVGVALCTTAPGRAQRTVAAGDFVSDVALSPDGGALAVTARGQVFTMGVWAGPVLRFGADVPPAGRARGVRYQHAAYLPDGRRLVVVSDAAGEPDVELHCEDGAAPPQPLGCDPEVSPRCCIARHAHPLPTPIPVCVGRDWVPPPRTRSFPHVRFREMAAGGSLMAVDRFLTAVGG